MMNSVKDIEIEIPDEDGIIFNDALKYLKDKCKNMTISTNTINLLIQYIMEYIENTELKGEKQKNMCIKVIEALVLELAPQDEQVILEKMLNDGTISNLIELIVSVSKGELNINQVAETTSRCVLLCIPYLFSKKNKTIKQ